MTGRSTAANFAFVAPAILRSRPSQRVLRMQQALRSWSASLPCARPSCDPAVLLARSRAPQLLYHDVLRDFRNLCAIATVVAGRTAQLGNGSNWLATHSDFFTFAHHVAGKDGAIVTLDGIVRGLDDDPEEFLFTASPMIDSPGSFSVHVDSALYDRLVRRWRRHHFGTRKTRRGRQLFRALEIAFQAARYPSDGMTSWNDIGTRIGLWVSAFEVLCHPGTTNVNKGVVQSALSAAAWTSKRFRAKRFRVTRNGKAYPATLAEKVYDGIYQARNDFMHGNRVAARSRSWRCANRSARLDYVAAPVFGVALYVATGLNHSSTLEFDELVAVGSIEKALRLEGVRARKT